MILIDSGPIIALFEPREEQHEDCVKAFKKLNEVLITSMPCLTEAMYFLGELRGWHGQSRLWDLIETQALAIHQLSRLDIRRMQVLMGKYKDTPMDFADASLVAMAERLNITQIFTLDSDFYVYRINEADNFEIIP